LEGRQAEQREDETRVRLKIHRRVIAGWCLDPKSYEAPERGLETARFLALSNFVANFVVRRLAVKHRMLRLRV
jgi:hypothetical protein